VESAEVKAQVQNLYAFFDKKKDDRKIPGHAKFNLLYIP